MASTFFGLTIASSGLRAANAALNTTANNVANSDTEGYSRQTVVTEAANALRTFTTYGCAGGGVETLSIERIRDSFYDEKYRGNESKVGEYDRKQYYMRIVEEYFKDDGKTGFKSIFDEMTKALQEVRKNPGNNSTKASYISSMKTLADYFNNMAGDMEDLQGDLNEEIKTQVYQINSIAEELATVNKQINIIEMTGSKANELRDKRDSLIDTLASYVKVDVSETPVFDINGNDTGATRCVIKIAGGLTLVDQNDYNSLMCVARKSYEKVNQTDIDGLYDVYWVNDDKTPGEQFRLDNGSLGGSLKGLADMRDGNNGEYFSGQVSAIDAGAQKVTITTSAPFLNGMSKCNLSDTGGTIMIDNTVYYFSDWTYSYDEVSGLSDYTFQLDRTLSATLITGSKNGKPAEIGSYSEYQGIPYYMQQMNEWIRDFSSLLNSRFMEGYTSDSENGGTLVLTGNVPSDTTQYDWDRLANDSDHTGKGYYYLTAANFAVKNELMDDASLLSVKKNASNGADECDIAEDVYKMMYDKTQFSFRGNDASGWLESIISDAALNASNANTFSASYESMQNLISNQRTSISGVDKDEEAVNLVKYQNSYTLASKVIQTLSEVYNRLILETGV